MSKRSAPDLLEAASAGRIKPKTRRIKTEPLYPEDSNHSMPQAADEGTIAEGDTVNHRPWEYHPFPNGQTVQSHSPTTNYKPDNINMPRNAFYHLDAQVLSRLLKDIVPPITARTMASLAEYDNPRIKAMESEIRAKSTVTIQPTAPIAMVGESGSAKSTTLNNVLSTTLEHLISGNGERGTYSATHFKPKTTNEQESQYVLDVHWKSYQERFDLLGVLSNDLLDYDEHELDSEDGEEDAADRSDRNAKKNAAAEAIHHMLMDEDQYNSANAVRENFSSSSLAWVPAGVPKGDREEVEHALQGVLWAGVQEILPMEIAGIIEGECTSSFPANTDEELENLVRMYGRYDAGNPGPCLWPLIDRVSLSFRTMHEEHQNMELVDLPGVPDVNGIVEQNTNSHIEGSHMVVLFLNGTAVDRQNQTLIDLYHRCINLKVRNFLVVVSKADKFEPFHPKHWLALKPRDPALYAQLDELSVEELPIKEEEAKWQRVREDIDLQRAGVHDEAELLDREAEVHSSTFSIGRKRKHFDLKARPIYAKAHLAKLETEINKNVGSDYPNAPPLKLVGVDNRGYSNVMAKDIKLRTDHSLELTGIPKVRRLLAGQPLSGWLDDIVRALDDTGIEIFRYWNYLNSEDPIQQPDQLKLVLQEAIKATHDLLTGGLDVLGKFRQDVLPTIRRLETKWTQQAIDEVGSLRGDPFDDNDPTTLRTIDISPQGMLSASKSGGYHKTSIGSDHDYNKRIFVDKYRDDTKPSLDSLHGYAKEMSKLIDIRIRRETTRIQDVVRSSAGGVDLEDFEDLVQVHAYDARQHTRQLCTKLVAHLENARMIFLASNDNNWLHEAVLPLWKASRGGDPPLDARQMGELVKAEIIKNKNRRLLVDPTRAKPQFPKVPQGRLDMRLMLFLRALEGMTPGWVEQISTKLEIRITKIQDQFKDALSGVVSKFKDNILQAFEDKFTPADRDPLAKPSELAIIQELEFALQHFRYNIPALVENLREYERMMKD